MDSKSVVGKRRRSNLLDVESDDEVEYLAERGPTKKLRLGGKEPSALAGRGIPTDSSDDVSMHPVPVALQPPTQVPHVVWGQSAADDQQEVPMVVEPSAPQMIPQDTQSLPSMDVDAPEQLAEDEDSDMGEPIPDEDRSLSAPDSPMADVVDEVDFATAVNDTLMTEASEDVDDASPAAEAVKDGAGTDSVDDTPMVEVIGDSEDAGLVPEVVTERDSTDGASVDVVIGDDGPDSVPDAVDCGDITSSTDDDPVSEAIRDDGSDLVPGTADDKDAVDLVPAAPVSEAVRDDGSDQVPSTAGDKGAVDSEFAAPVGEAVDLVEEVITVPDAQTAIEVHEGDTASSANQLDGKSTPYPTPESSPEPRAIPQIDPAPIPAMTTAATAVRSGEAPKPRSLTTYRPVRIAIPAASLVDPEVRAKLGYPPWKEPKYLPKDVRRIQSVKSGPKEDRFQPRRKPARSWRKPAEMEPEEDNAAKAMNPSEPSGDSPSPATVAEQPVS